MKTLKKGSKGKMVEKLQTLLNTAGCECGKVDGVFGKNTEAAVKAFQKENRLAVDGMAGLKTFEALFLKTKTEPKTEHFKLSEFKCHNGTKVPTAYYGNVQELMFQLEEIRAACGNAAIHIQSGYRTKEYNSNCSGASPRSQHLTASAADIKVKGMAPAEVYKICDKLVGSRGGVGKYKNFTHNDIRGYQARW